MVCKLNNGETVVINSIEDMKDYIDEDLYNVIENTDVYSLKECIKEVKNSLNYMKDNINNSKRLNKEKIIKEINNVLNEINYYN